MFPCYAVPSSAPETVTANSISTFPSMIQVAWGEVPAIHKNGIITMYEIEYWQTGEVDNTSNVTVGSDVFLLVLTMLEDFVNYRVRVRAYTALGPGPYSLSIVAELNQKGTQSAHIFVCEAYSCYGRYTHIMRDYHVCEYSVQLLLVHLST